MSDNLLMPLHGKDVICSEWDKHGFFSPQQQIRVKISGDVATVQVFEQNVVEWFLDLISQAFGKEDLRGHVLEARQIELTQFPKENLSDKIILPHINSACHEQAGRIDAFLTNLRLFGPKKATTKEPSDLQLQHPISQISTTSAPTVARTDQTATTTLATPSPAASVPQPAAVKTTHDIGKDVLSPSTASPPAPTSTPTKAPDSTRSRPRSVSLPLPRYDLMQRIVQYNERLEDLSLANTNPETEQKIETLRNALQDISQVPLAINYREEAIGPQTARIQLQSMIASPPESTIAMRDGVKAALIEEAKQAVLNTPTGQTTIKMTPEQATIAKLLSQLMEKAKNDLPQKRQALEDMKRATQQSTLQAFANALQYKHDPNFDTRFDLEMGQAVDEVLDNLTRIQGLYQDAGIPLPGSTAHTLLHSEPVENLVAAVDTLTLTFPRQTESLASLKNELLSGLAKAFSAVQAEPLSNFPAALDIEVRPIIEKFVTNLRAFPELNNAQGRATVAKALPSPDKSPAEQAEEVVSQIVVATAPAKTAFNIKSYKELVNKAINASESIMPKDKPGKKELASRLIDGFKGTTKAELEALLHENDIPIPKTSSSKSTSADQKSAAPAPFKRPSRKGIKPPTTKPSIFDVAALQDRNEKLEEIGQQIAALELQQLVNVTPGALTPSELDAKALITDWLGQKVEAAPAGATGIKVSEQEQEVVNTLTKITEDAKKEFPEQKPQLEHLEKSFKNNLGRVLHSAAQYKNDPHFRARFDLELSPVLDGLFQGVKFIKALYETAGKPLPTGATQAALESGLPSGVDAALGAIMAPPAESIEAQKEAVGGERQLLRADAQARLDKEINEWAEKGTSSLPTLNKFSDIIGTLAENPRMTPELRAPLLTMCADIEEITGNLAGAIRKPDDLRTVIHALVENNSTALREASELASSTVLTIEAPPTQEEVIRSAVNDQIDAVKGKIAEAFAELEKIGPALGNNDSVEFVHVSRKLEQHRKELEALEKGYNPSWIPFTATKKIEELSLKELQGYQSYAAGKLKALTSFIDGELNAIRSVSEAIGKFKSQLHNTGFAIAQLQIGANGQKPQILAATTLIEVVATRLEKMYDSAKFLAEDEAESNLLQLADTIDRATDKLAKETDRLQREDEALGLKEQLARLPQDSLEAEKLREAYVNKVQAESEKAKKLHQETIASYQGVANTAKDPLDFALLNLFDADSVGKTLSDIDTRTERAVGGIPSPDKNTATIEQLLTYRNAVREANEKGQAELDSLSKAFKDVVETQKEFDVELKDAEQTVEQASAKNEPGYFAQSKLLEKAIEGAKEARRAFLKAGSIDSAERANAFTQLLGDQLTAIDERINDVEVERSPLEQLEIDESAHVLTAEQRQALATQIYQECRSTLVGIAKIYREFDALVNDPVVKEYLPEKLWVKEMRDTASENVTYLAQFDNPATPAFTMLKEIVKMTSAEAKKGAEFEEKYTALFGKKYAVLKEFATAAKEHDAALKLAEETVKALRARPIPQHTAADELERMITTIKQNRAEDMGPMNISRDLGSYTDKLVATNLKLELARLAALASDTSLPEQLSALAIGSAEYKQALKATIEPQLKALGNQAAILENASESMDTLEKEKFVFSDSWKENFTKAVNELYGQISSLQTEFDTGWVFSNKQKLTRLTPDQVKTYQKKVAQTLSKSVEVNDLLAELNSITEAYTRYMEATTNAQEIAAKLKEDGYTEIAESLQESIVKASLIHVQAKRDSIYSITRTYDQPLIGGTSDHITAPDAYPTAVASAIEVLDEALSAAQAQHGAALEAKQLATAKQQAKEVGKAMAGHLNNMQNLEHSHPQDFKTWNNGEYINHRNKIIAAIKSSINALTAAEADAEKRKGLQNLKADITTNAANLKSENLGAYIKQLEKLAE